MRHAVPTSAAIARCSPGIVCYNSVTAYVSCGAAGCRGALTAYAILTIDGSAFRTLRRKAVSLPAGDYALNAS